ncbi:rod shape-determining protein MreC [Hydrogenispora ethanolica]|uniref:Cell shape-determining protein MreC n=1 Tax=Hydrogenispora ethanolica TaxID=1082276 RepID=A0A4R1RW86_HYDET|nr:rod shape-determining protein MreC [Hydrogenispora ethanolica]
MLHLFTDRRYLLVALIILIITWGMFVTSRERPREGKIEYFFNTAMAPLESVFNRIGGAIDDSWRTVNRLSRLKVDNDRLRAENSRLKARQAGLDKLRAENNRLREALKFQQSQPHELIGAEPISVNPSNWYHTIIINKGAADGIGKNMAVINPEGVVGRIGEVRSNTAEVILITDPREGNNVGGVVNRTQDLVIVTGGGFLQGECTVKPAVETYFSSLKKGDLVYTGETSEIFPRGIRIGRVIQVSRGANKLASKAVLKPAVHLGKLQMIFVIKTKRDLPVTPAPISGGGE